MILFFSDDINRNGDQLFYHHTNTAKRILCIFKKKQKGHKYPTSHRQVKNVLQPFNSLFQKKK